MWPSRKYAVSLSSDHVIAGSLLFAKIFMLYLCGVCAWFSRILAFWVVCIAGCAQTCALGMSWRPSSSLLSYVACMWYVWQASLVQDVWWLGCGQITRWLTKYNIQKGATGLNNTMSSTSTCRRVCTLSFSTYQLSPVALFAEIVLNDWLGEKCPSPCKCGRVYHSAVSEVHAILSGDRHNVDSYRLECSWTELSIHACPVRTTQSDLLSLNR